MRLVYEASSALEAHMILNLLEQADLSGRIDGEYLQGGAGELQVGGVVRVMVEEEDYVVAREIIQEWDKHQSERFSHAKGGSSSESGYSWGSGLVGFICGVIFLSIFDNTAIVKQGVDYNNDGSLDEQHFTENGAVTRTEYDRNLDGRVDKRFHFERSGRLISSESDEDFNGSFETLTDFEHDQKVRSESDTVGDGIKDLQMEYRHGVLTKTRLFSPDTGKPIKVQYFDGFRLVKAEFDSDGDGHFDTLYQYDKNGEVSGTSHFTAY